MGKEGTSSLEAEGGAERLAEMRHEEVSDGLCLVSCQMGGMRGHQKSHCLF